MIKLSILFLVFFIAISTMLSKTDVVSANTSTISPSIKLVKEANPASLPAGGGQVVYTYRVKNIGNVELTNITLSDDKCGAISFIGGDTNINSKLDIAETWAYQCSMSIVQTTTNFVTAHAFAGSAGVTDFASVIVTVGIVSNKLPKTGGGGFLADLINSAANITGLFGAASAAFYFKYARR